ncbi:MAG: flagellar motor switch protein FliG [Spirochaetaceae bacterium]|jgi:flagellar motor switch protein FliG|nr:flagellar motor switch protein FliG [Spirochaetaceae bacterium]
MKQNDKRLDAYRKVSGSGEKKEDSADNVSSETVRPFTFPRFDTPSSNETTKSAVPKQGLPSIPAAADDDGLLKTAGKDTVYRRVAKFLLLIGTDEAAKVIAHLTPEQTEKIVPEIASIRRLDKDEAAVILAEFETLLVRARESGGVDTARTILEKAFGEERADEMLKKAVPYPEGKPFDYLSEMDGDRLFQLLKGESAAIRAVVLSRIQPSSAAAAIKLMPSGEKNEVIMRLAKMGAISPEVIRRIDESMREKVQNTSVVSAESIDGRGALAEILRRMDFRSESSILETLADADPELGQDIRHRLFTIEDVIGADDKYLQTKLRDMNEGEIALLIAGKSEDFRKKILSNISKTRGAMVLEEESLRKPISRRDSDTITNTFLSSLRRAWEQGDLYISGRDEEIYV